MYIVEDCFTPWLIHDEGEIILSIFKEFIFSISEKKKKKKFLEDTKYNFTFITFMYQNL